MINDNFIRNYLINYWDCNGSLSGLSINAKRIYSLIMDRRRKTDPKKPVNDYIYYELGVQALGDLGEELTFMIRNHLNSCASLSDYKTSDFYSKLQRRATKLETTPEEMLHEAGLSKYLEAPSNSANHSNLNLHFKVCSEIVKQVLESQDQSITLAIYTYLQEKRTFSKMKDELPGIYKIIDSAVSYEFGGYYDSNLTNADALLANGKMYFKAEEETLPLSIPRERLISEILYSVVGFTGVDVLSPSLRYALSVHLNRYKTLVNLAQVNTRLYSELKKVYLMSPKYYSLADMLRAEGYYYPQLSLDNVQFIPCQDKKHIICVSDVNSHAIILDRPVMSYLLENNIQDDLILREHNDLTYVSIQTKDAKQIDYPPFHMIYTGINEAYHMDNNYLNISSSNIITS